MKVYLGADHGGYELKEEIKIWLAENNIAGEDLGARELVEDDDYPDFVVPVAQRVAADPGSLGIVIGRSGNGEAIATNKVKGVRAAVCTNVEMAKKAREHNNANVLALGADFISTEQAKEMVKVFLETDFSGEERHKRRLEKIKNFEVNNP